MPFLKTDRGIPWHYELEGDGPAILFIHGWGVDSRVWRQQTKYFSQEFKILTIDLPGHGRTAWQAISLGDIAEDFIAVLHHLNLNSAGIVCSSFGGLVALKMYEQRPLSVDFLVFVGSQPKFFRSDDYPTSLSVERIKKLAEQIDTHYETMVQIFFRSLFTKHERQTRRYKWIHTFRKTEKLPEKQALLAGLHMLERQDLRDVLKRVSVPLQFINGSEDYICPRKVFDHIKSWVPHAQFEWFDRCGHFPFLSKPREFNQVLEKFFHSLGHKTL